MKKKLFILVLAGLFLSIDNVMAQGESNRQPFKALGDSISGLENRIEKMEANSILPGKLEERLTGLEKSFDSFSSNVKDFMVSADDRLFMVAERLGILSDEMENLKKENITMKEQLSAINDYINTNGNSGGESKKTVYSGTVPANISEADVTTHILENSEGNIHSHDNYYKRVEITEINVDDMPQIGLYAKVANGEASFFGETAVAGDIDVWENRGHLLYIKDKNIYIRFATQDSEGLEYLFPENRDYKVVVSN